jgi:hypothetical protein
MIIANYEYPVAPLWSCSGITDWQKLNSNAFINRRTGLTSTVVKNVPVRLLGTRFEPRNCTSEPGPRESYGDIF